jgi:hypothetical protein
MFMGHLTPLALTLFEAVELPEAPHVFPPKNNQGRFCVWHAALAH